MGVGEKVINVKEKDLDSIVTMVPREDWQALSPTGEMLPLEVPLHNIVLTWTDTEPCEMPEECEQRVRDVQKSHMDKGLPDIQYNFLVGGDKKIYVGRGWDHEPPRYPEETIENAFMFNGKCVEIAFIEKHLTDPSKELVHTVAAFISLSRYKEIFIRPIYTKGIKNNKIVAFCKVLPRKYHEPCLL